LLAGDSAARAFGHDEAVEHFEQALALGERHPLVGDAAMDRIAVRERLGDELLLVRKWASSAASFNASFALIDPAARTARARLLRKLARIDERQSRYADAMRHLEAAQAQLGDPDELEPNAWWASGSTSRSRFRSSTTGRGTWPAWMRPMPEWLP
jgi:tetratricopeptide (TPR) repeat protein